MSTGTENKKRFTDADQNLAAKVVLGGGGAVGQLRDVVDAVSLRVDAVVKVVEQDQAEIAALREEIQILKQNTSDERLRSWFSGMRETWGRPSAVCCRRMADECRV